MGLTQTTATRGVVISLDDHDDLEYLRSLEPQESSSVAVICLRREDAGVPTWFEPTARALAERRPVAVLRYRAYTTGFTDCRGQWQDVLGPDLSAAVRGLVEGTREVRSPGYRELVAEDLDR